MQKITEIKQIKYRTTYHRDSLGNRIQKKTPYTGFRKVTVISGGRRYAHYFIDQIAYYFIFYIINFLITAILMALKSEPLVIVAIESSLVPFFFVSWPAFYVFFEYKFQRTPGKFLTKCKVVDIYGNKPSIGTLILRNVIRFVPFEAFSCLSERGWHDRWSDTFVVPYDEYNKLQEILNSDKQEEFTNE